jgi:SPW repeat
VRAMRMIPTRMHGLMDYVVGIVLIASPWIFGFHNESSTATWTFVILGIAVLATSLMTNYELGLMHVVPMHMHLWADAIVGLVLALSPWIFGYADNTGTNGWLPAVVIGVLELGTAAMSDPWPERNDVAERERRMVRHTTA